MRTYIPDWNLPTWLASLAALVTIMGFALALFSGNLMPIPGAPIPGAPIPGAPIPGAPISNDGRSHVPWGKDTPVSEFVENIREIAQGLIAALESAPGSLFDSSVLQSRQRLELLADQVKTVARRWTDETYCPVSEVRESPGQQK